MKISELVREWETNGGGPRTAAEYNVRLALDDAARVHALAELFPNRTETQIITELLGAALDELEGSLPYVQGEEVVAEDEFGDPIHGDRGLTPRLHALTRKHLKRLAEELKSG